MKVRRSIPNILGLRVLLVAPLLFVVSCANGGKAAQSRISSLETELNDLRSFQAEQTTQIAAVQTQIRELSGRVEELEFAQQKRLGGDITKLQKSISTLKRRVPPPAIVPGIELEEDESLAAKMPPNLSEKFTQALQSVREGAYSEALPVLQECLDLSFGNEYQANIQFWTAVAHDGLNQYQDALKGYHDLIVQFPRHPRSSLSLLRQGSLFIRMRDTEAAKAVFQKLIKEYPGTTEAARAKERLRDL